MAKMIQIRHVPDSVHRKLKARAAKKGMSLSGFLLREVEKIADGPDWEQLRQRIFSREPIILSKSPAEILREERNRR